MKLQESAPARAPVTVSLAALAVAIAAPAHAQPADDGFVGQTIVVTGITRQDADIQDTPTAITAFNATALEEKGIVDVGSLANFTPGFNIRTGSNNPTALNLSMRGQVQNDTLATLEPSVGVYLDEMYIARAYGLNSELVDMSNVQVLKGPQGTLFGRNTSAGAVLLRTNDPVLGEFSGLVRGTWGRFDQREGTAVLNVPVGEDVAVRGAIFYGKRDGYQRDVHRDVRYGDKETLNGRVKLSADITPDLNLLLSGEWYRSDIDGPARQNLAFAGAGDPAAGDRDLFGGDPDRVAVTDLSTYPGAPRPDLYNEIRTQTYGMRLSLATDFGQVKFIGGYRQIKGDNILDLDGSSAPGHFTQGIQNLKQYSGELQFTGQAFNDLVDFAAGATYFRETGFDVSRSSLMGSPNWSGYSGSIDNDSFGLYSQVSVHATERLNINAGVRYSIDDKGVTTQSALYPGNGTVPQTCFPTSYMIDKSRTPAGDGTLVPEDCNRGRRDSFNHISWTAGVDYNLTDDVMVYAKYSNGYRSGAQQLRSMALDDTAPARPEVVDEQEIGIKTRFLNGRATLNLAGYHNEVSDAQRSVILSVGGFQRTILENADTETWGVEADASLEVTDGLQLFASGALIDAKYKRYDGFIAVNGVLTPYDKSDSRMVGIARKQFAVGAAYDRDLGAARLNLSANYSWQSKMNHSLDQAEDFLRNGVPADLVEHFLDATAGSSFGVTNARASVSFGPDRNYEIAVWGRNIFDERSTTSGLYLGGGLNYVAGYWNEPATYGITGTVRF